MRSWEELPTAKQAAARSLGYTPQEWDSEMRDSEPAPDNGEVGKFAVGEDVLAYDAAGTCMAAKVLAARRSTDAADGGGREYQVHYRGWRCGRCPYLSIGAALLLCDLLLTPGFVWLCV